MLCASMLMCDVLKVTLLDVPQRLLPGAGQMQSAHEFMPRTATTELGTPRAFLPVLRAFLRVQLPN